MDIGVPVRDLGPVDITAAAEHVAAMPESAWTENTFRQDVLADGVHSVTQSILFRHEWRRWENPHMKIGRVYDFNNRWRHSVQHNGKRPRINLFIDYYPNPEPYIPPPYGHL